MAAYIETEVGCDITGCQNHDKATLVVTGLGMPSDSCGLQVHTLPAGWTTKFTHWYSVSKAILCPEHSK